jgi:hypothetical protein
VISCFAGALHRGQLDEPRRVIRLVPSGALLSGKLRDCSAALSMSMKKLLVIITLGTAFAAPAFAQHEPSANDRASQRHTVPSGDIYYGRNGSTNPDLQSSSARWRRVEHRARPASRSVKKK